MYTDKVKRKEPEITT